MEDKIRNIVLEIAELSRKLLEESDITASKIEMSLTLLGEAKKLLLLAENHCFK